MSGSASRPLSVGIDVTPLAGARTGIGRYVEQLLAELARHADLDLRAAAFTLRGRQVLGELPQGVRPVRRPVPARLLHRGWLRGGFPPAEWVLGRTRVVHGTNFVLPPPRHAAGVVTVHDLSFLRFPELVSQASLDYRILVPAATRRAALVLTPTEAIAAEVRETYRLAEDRVRATPLGVAPEWFAATPADDVARPYLLAVGTLEPRKGLDTLLKAYRRLLTERDDLPPLMLVGPSGWGPELERTGLGPDRLILPGYLDTERLRRLVAGAELLAFPSRYEGFGLPPLEALAAGTPVVTTEVPAITEVVGAATGMVHTVPVDDVDALAAAVSDRLDRPPTDAERAAGREHARGFTWARCADLTAQAYRDAAAA